MITARDIAEIKSTVRKEDSSIVRMKGCYVEYNGEIITEFKNGFLNLDEPEYLKYTKIARTPYQQKQIGNKVLTLHFEEVDTQRLLKEIVKSELKDDELIQKLYEKIIDEAPVIGKMLILVFYGVYDVVVRANDGEELEDSEDVYSYIEVVACPVDLQQEGLMYQEEKNTFGPVERKWIVKKPEFAFIFPAFDHRSADEQEVIYFAENPLEPHHEIMEGALGCHDIWTAAEHKQHLTKSIFTACDSEELTKEYIEGFNASLAGIIAQEEPKTLNPEQFRSVLELWMPKEYAQKVAEDYRNLYQDGYPEVELLYDEKAKDRHYAKKKHKKGLELLRISADAHKANGETDIASEIYEYLEGVR